jgi:hypothetical protein
VPPSQTTPRQHNREGRAPAMFVERGRPRSYRTWYGSLTTCPIHYWSGPNLAIPDDGSMPVCWETGHLVDEGEARRVAR